MLKTEIQINDKTYEVLVAVSDEERTTGLSKTKELDSDEGMIFMYPEPQEELTFTMKNTSIDLDIIFIDKTGMVMQVESVKAFSEDPIIDKHDSAQYVLEVPINSGIEPGDLIEEIDEDLDDDEKEIIKSSKMLILDENGDVQYKLHGGERIVSRIATRMLVKQAVRAYRSETDEDFIKLGRMVFRTLNQLDLNEPQYVELPEKKEE